MTDVPDAIEAVWKIESTRLMGVGEEPAQDAPVTASELRLEEGIPDNPGAWLVTPVLVEEPAA